MLTRLMALGPEALYPAGSQPFCSNSGCTTGRVGHRGREYHGQAHQSTSIHAPIKKVFEYFSNPANLPEFWPSLMEVKDIEQLPTGGHRYNWVYKMAGLRFEGSTETTEVVPNEHIVAKSKGGIDSTFIWDFRGENGWTTVTTDVEYTIPVPLLGKLAASFILKQNEQEAETLLANLKARMES